MCVLKTREAAAWHEGEKTIMDAASIIDAAPRAPKSAAAQEEKFCITERVKEALAWN